MGRRSSKLTIIFDLETTGFAPMPTFSNYHRIVQICAMCLETQAFFAEFVDPGAEIPKASTATHNILTNHIRKAPDTLTVMERMAKFFNFAAYEEVQMIAHNCRWFDKPILLKEYLSEGAEVPPNMTFWDTLPWFRKNFAGLPKGYSLGALHQYFFKKEILNAHRADADVKALARLYVEIVVPKLSTSKETPVEDRITAECLTSIYYVGPHRAGLFVVKCGVNTVSELKRYWKTITLTDRCALDTFLMDEIGVANISHRMLIVSQILDIPIYDDAIREHLNVYVDDDDCLDVVDYFVKYRYYLKKPAPNQCHYQRGLMAVKNKYFK